MVGYIKWHFDFERGCRGPPGLGMEVQSSLASLLDV